MRRPRRRRQQQRAQRLAVALALERAAERQRAGRTRSRSTGCRPPRPRAARPSFTNANEKTSTHDDREEQRRVEDLAALHLDREVLPQHEQRGAQEHRHAAPDRARDSARAGRAPPARRDSSRPSRTSATRVTRPSARSRSCVASDDDGAGRPRARAAGRDTTPTGAIVEAGERLVEQHQPRLVQQRALEREPLAHAARETRRPRRRRDR